MCFYDQHRFACGDWKWGHFRQHCSREYRIGETCGMKLIMQTIPTGTKCKLCEKIDTKMRRRAAEVERIRRWQRGDKQLLDAWQRGEKLVDALQSGELFHASTKKSMELIELYNAEIYELKRERDRRLRDIGALGVTQTKEEKQRLQAFHLMVSSDMRNSRCPTTQETHDKKLAAGDAQLTLTAPSPTPKQCILGSTATRSGTSSLELNYSSRQIRLFELKPRIGATDIIQGSFRCVELEACPAYTALSYTWGDATDIQQIIVDEGGVMDVRKNLWEFLCQQSLVISEPKLFWIDAICINQSNVHERNHQIKLMKEIYVRASEVYIWLGREADNSGLAMQYIAKKGTRELRPRGLGFRPIWTRGRKSPLLSM